MIIVQKLKIIRSVLKRSYISNKVKGSLDVVILIRKNEDTHRQQLEPNYLKLKNVNITSKRGWQTMPPFNVSLKTFLKQNQTVLKSNHTKNDNCVRVT